MAFKFGLESILKHRKRLEDVAQREYLEAKQKLDESLNRIDQMYNRCDEVRGEIQAAQAAGSMLNIIEMEKFLLGQKIRINNERAEARRLMQIAEAKQELLMEASKDKKILVKLKEKRLAEYKVWLAHLEAKAQDDMTTTRHNWGKL